MIAVDSSVAIAAFGDWHDRNAEAVAMLDEGASLPAHAMLETYSVLTAFPAPHRAPPGIVIAWLDDRFGEILPPPPPAAQHDLVRTLAGASLIGGSVYDGLVGLTAKLVGATLVTADVRASSTYELIGVDLRRLGGAPG